MTSDQPPLHTGIVLYMIYGKTACIPATAPRQPITLITLGQIYQFEIQPKGLQEAMKKNIASMHG